MELGVFLIPFIAKLLIMGTDTCFDSLLALQVVIVRQQAADPNRA